jgi:hypothetical protein
MAASPVLETRSTSRPAEAIRVIALVVGVGFLVVGVLGFIPAATRHHDALAWHQTSRTVLFDHFRVSRTMLVADLAFGAVAVLAAASAWTSRAVLAIGGLLGAALFVYTVVVIDYHTVNYLALNRADGWAFLGIAIALIAAAWLAGLPARHRVFTRVGVGDLQDPHFGSV